MRINMRILSLAILFFSSLAFCQEKATESTYLNFVGDIKFNPETDNQDFKICYDKHIYQYFNFGNGLEYKGEKFVIEKVFKDKFVPENGNNETGLIRINFVVNCVGKTDRFRIISMDENYNEKVFSTAITEQLLAIAKTLDGWEIKKYNNEISIDYYQYLIFKIENGQIKEILP